MLMLTAFQDLVGGSSVRGTQASDFCPRNGSVPKTAYAQSGVTVGSRKAYGTETTDFELIERLLNGDPTAPGRFVRRFERLIHRLLHTQGVSAQDHEDLFQEVFLRLWERDFYRLRLWRGREDSLFSSYLRVLVRHLICDLYRKRGTIDPEPSWGTPLRDPETLLLSREQTEALEQALEKLSERDRELIVRRHLREESYREIATGMGLTVNHVGVALARAEKRLKADLHRSYGDLFGGV